MKRREFFELGARKTVQTALDLLGERARRRAENWLRPPFALAELDFLLTCTRCEECIQACPHDVLFKLPARLGIEVVGTPAMDLLARGCRMCADWPCVAACEPGALKRVAPDPDRPPVPVRLAHVEIESETCLPYSGPECGACAESCTVPGALMWQGGVKPWIDQALCTGCAMCREACILEPKAVTVSALPHSEETAAAP
jgi:ferredoxin-type protein NapG